MANDEASDLIEPAIGEALRSFEDYKEGDLLVEWVVMTYITNPDRKRGDAYPIMFSNGLMPTHHAIGLLRKTLMRLELGLLDDDVEEE